MNRIWLKRAVVPLALSATGLAWIAFMATIGEAAQTLAVAGAVVVAIEMTLALTGVILYVMVTRLTMGWALGLPRDRSIADWLRYFFGLKVDKGDIFESPGTPATQALDEARVRIDQAMEATERAARLSRVLPSALVLEHMQSEEVAALGDAVQAYIKDALTSPSQAEGELEELVRASLEALSAEPVSSGTLREAVRMIAEGELALLENKLSDPDLQRVFLRRWAQHSAASESLFTVCARLSEVHLEMREASEGLERALGESSSTEPDEG